jgi:hypothetical protein
MAPSGGRIMPQKVVIDADFGTDTDDAIAVALAMGCWIDSVEENL